MFVGTKRRCLGSLLLGWVPGRALGRVNAGTGTETGECRDDLRHTSLGPTPESPTGVTVRDRDSATGRQKPESVDRREERTVL